MPAFELVALLICPPQSFLHSDRFRTPIMLRHSAGSLLTLYRQRGRKKNVFIRGSDKWAVGYMKFAIRTFLNSWLIFFFWNKFSSCPNRSHFEPAETRPTLIQFGIFFVDDVRVRDSCFCAVDRQRPSSTMDAKLFVFWCLQVTYWQF
jgi:hypothetical protein